MRKLVPSAKTTQKKKDKRYKCNKPDREYTKSKQKQMDEESAQLEIEKTYTEDLIRQDHTQITTDMIKDLTDKYLGQMQFDPLVSLLKAMQDDSNPTLATHRIAFNLLRLLCVRAVSRMGTRAPVNAHGIAIYPLTTSELAQFTKLAQTVVSSKNTLINVRKQKNEEKQDDTVTIPCYTKEEIEILAKKAKDEKDE